MIDFLCYMTRATTGILVDVPVSIVLDALTAGGVAVGEDEAFITQALREVKTNIVKATNGESA